MNKTTEQSSQKNEILIRGLYMLFFIMVYSVSKFLMIGIMLFQFVTILLTEKPNEQILKLSNGLSAYIYQIIRFLAFNSEQRPFPFSKWPDVRQNIIEDPVSDQTPDKNIKD